jgi:hypothetical protein
MGVACQPPLHDCDDFGDDMPLVDALDAPLVRGEDVVNALKIAGIRLGQVSISNIPSSSKAIYICSGQSAILNG